MANRRIFLFEVIDSYSSQNVIQQLLAFDRESSDEITIFINSPGGSVYQMFAILDTMSIIKSPVRTVIIGMAASAAACLAAAGKTRLISRTAQMMIHEASAGTFGSVSQMQETLEQISKSNEMMIACLSKCSGKSVDEIKKTIDKTDKYFSAQEAVSFGLVDNIISDSEAQILKLSEKVSVDTFEITSTDKEVQMLREGKYLHPEYGWLNITESVLNTLKKNFDAGIRGQEISIDVTHDNENGESPAAFWIKSLEVKKNSDGNGKGLFARGEYTSKGIKLISGKEYKYSSADFVIDYVDQHGKHHPYVLRGGTLTNRPFIKNMDPIKLAEPHKKNKEAVNMTKEELIAALKTEHGFDISAIEQSVTRVKELEAKIIELSALPAKKEEEISALKTKLSEINAKIISEGKLKVFEDLVLAGKVVPAQKEAILATFPTATEMEAFYKDAPAVLKTKATGSDTNDIDAELSPVEAALVKEGLYTKEDIIKYRKIS